jgi:ATP-binding cassette subfamily B (MDR/TAP) protein 1
VGKPAAYKMFETVNRVPEIDAYSPASRKLDDIPGGGYINFRVVHFSNLTKPGEQILRGFILIDVVNIKELQLVWSRGQISLVRQEPRSQPCLLLA